MKLRSPVILGLAFDDRSVACAEVHTRGERREQRRLGRFVYPAGATPAEPAACGAALRAFLAEHGFDAKRAVVGVPAKWLIAAERELPPSDPEAALGILRMHGERMALAGGSELIVDVAGDVTRDTGRALLVGILRQQLDRLTQLVEAAGLEVAAVTSTSLVLHAVAKADGPLVLVGEGGTELVAGAPGAARLLRHVSTANPSTDSGVNQLGSELKRTLALAGQGGGRISVWDGGRLDGDQRGRLAERTGVTIDRAAVPDAKLASDALNGAAAGLGAEAFAPAVALGMAGGSRRPLPVDFVDPRLAPPVVRRFGRRAVWGVGIGVAAVAAFALLLTTVQSREAEAERLAAEQKTIAPTVTAAEATIARVALGRTYYENRGQMLGAMREVALAFNYDEPIWASSLSVSEKLECTLQGKTTDRALAFELRDRLAANPRVAGVQLGDFRGSGGRAGEQTFTIKFNFVGKD